MQEIKLTLFVLFFICEANLNASNKVEFNSEFRVRSEYRAGYKLPLDLNLKAGFLTLQRTRIGFSYKSDFLTTQFTIQDSRVFGQYTNASTESSFIAYEAWSEFCLFPYTNIKVGRQTLHYDDGRLFAAPSWSNTGISHDMILFKSSINDWRFHLALAYNNDNEVLFDTKYSDKYKYRSLYLGWLAGKISDNLNISAILVNEGVQDSLSKMKHSFTYGGNLNFTSSDKSFQASLSCYLQSGVNKNSLKMSGEMYSVILEYKVNQKFSTFTGFDFFSGDNISGDNKQTNFKKLYGSDHTYNGYMDYWNTPPERGLTDFYIGLKIQANSKSQVKTNFHWFHTDNPQGICGFIGSEFDILFDYNFKRIGDLQLGLCSYIKNANTLILKKTDFEGKTRFPHWAYVMLTIRPEAFNKNFNSN